MKKYFLAYVSNHELNDSQSNDEMLDDMFNTELSDFKAFLKNTHGIEITLYPSGMHNTIVSIDERDYNLFILFNKCPFYERCCNLFVKIVNMSYDIEYETSIEWDEVDEFGDLL